MRVRLIGKTLGLISVLCLTAALNQLPAFAWNDFGHMAVACRAYEELTPQARKRANELLTLNPYYKLWTTQIDPTIDKNLQLFMLASVWPDAIRKDSQYESDGLGNGFIPGGPESSRNVGYTDKLKHQYWHFMDTPFSSDGSVLPSVPSPNALSQIQAFTHVLEQPDASDDLKSYDLVWLLHIVGDVHQPLHCATRVGKAFEKGDSGGCDVAVRTADSETSLHLFWDAAAGNSLEMKTIIAYARSLAKPEAQSACKDDPRQWFNEGFKLAVDKVYKSPVGGAKGPYKLTKRYEDEARALASKRIALAGTRLANLLNKELK